MFINLVLILSIAGATEAGSIPEDECTFRAMTSSCDFFSHLGVDDQLITPSGFTVPACSLPISEAQKKFEYDQFLIDHSFRVKTILSKSKKVQVHPEVIADWVTGGWLSELYAEKSDKIPVDLPLSNWPSSGRVKVVDGEGFRAEIAEQLGAEIADELISELKRSHEVKKSQFAVMRADQVYVVDRAALERRERLFDEAKAFAKKYLLNGRNREQMSREEQILLGKLEAVSISKLEPADLRCGGSVSAVFRPGGSVVHLPYHYLFYPDEAIFQTILHEIGHAIDFCVAQAPDKAGNVPRDAHPFRDIGKCLLERRSSGAFRQMSGGGVFGNCMDRRHIEAFADWFAAEVQATHPRLGRLDPVAAPLKPVGTIRAGRRMNMPRGMSGVLSHAEIGCRLRTEFDTHPVSAARIDEIFMLQPELRKKMGCTRPALDPGCRMPDGPPSRGAVELVPASR